MGLPMPQIHSPTLDSTKSLQSADDAAELDTLPLPDLIKRKERLESELSALGSVLDSHGVNMRTTLTTFDGYPRADIDIAQVRSTRARIIYLRNDHKDILSRIEKGLHAHFAATAASSASNPSSSAAPIPATASSVTRSTSTDVNAPTADGSTSRVGPPFATVNSISPNSPAAAAGLRVADRIQKFGDADWFNNEKLSLVARVVGRSEGRPIEVVVSRQSGDAQDTHEQISLVLVPRSGWGGRGMLGCHLLPL